MTGLFRRFLFLFLFLFLFIFLTASFLQLGIGQEIKQNQPINLESLGFPSEFSNAKSQDKNQSQSQSNQKLKPEQCTEALCYPAEHHADSLKAGSGAGIGWGWRLLVLFGFGILLAFTPCIWPMVPILSGIILGQGANKTLARGCVVSLSYVLGMACSYAVLGLLIVRAGASFQSVFQSAWIVGGVIIILILMACSMFGLFSLQLPVFMRHWVSLVDQRLIKKSSLGAVFLMGVLSILVISPCASAPLIAILSLMVQTGDMYLGALALFVLALGMGVPLVLFSIGLGHYLPRTGPWMQRVKYFMGILILCVAGYLLIRVLPFSLSDLSDLSPLSYFQEVGNQSALSSIETAPIKKTAQAVKSMAELENRLSHAPKDKIIVLDFYANWCIDCQRLADELAQQENQKDQKDQKKSLLDNKTFIKIDVSEDSKEAEDLMKAYHVLGLPTLILLAPVTHQEIGRLAGAGSSDALKKFLSVR